MIGTNHIKKKNSVSCAVVRTLLISLPALFTPYLKIYYGNVPHSVHFKADEIFPVSMH